MKISFQIFDLIYGIWFRFSKILTAALGRNMLAVKTEEKMMERWRRTPLTLLNLESTTDIFIDQVHKFQNSFFKEYFSKAATILQKACILRTCYEICSWQNPSKSTSIEACRNTQCIHLCFQFPIYRLVRCFKFSFYYIRSMCGR